MQSSSEAQHATDNNDDDDAIIVMSSSRRRRRELFPSSLPLPQPPPPPGFGDAADEEGSKKAKRPRTKQEEEHDALEDVLAMCNGEIIPMVPNLQLFHFVMAYGHCGGGEGVCMDSVPRLMSVQSRIYSKHLASMAQNFSAAMANNQQSKFAPNDWIDTFCKLIVDADIGLPRIQKVAVSFEQLMVMPGPRGSDGAGAYKQEEEQPHQQLHLLLTKDMHAMTTLMRRACLQCYERRLVDLSSMVKHPDAAVAAYFPAAVLGRAAASAPGSEERRALVHRSRDMLLLWAVNLIRWTCDMYESSCLCCFEDVLEISAAATASCFRMPSPRRMGLTKDEFYDWSNVVTSLVRKRLRLARRELIPRVKKALNFVDDDDRLLVSALKEVLTICWDALVVVNMEMVNIILFYISYPIRSRGEPFVRTKLRQLLDGTWGTDRMLALLSRLPGGVGCGRSKSVSPPPLLRLCQEDVCRRVASIMRHGSGAWGVSPLISIRLMQFTYGSLQIMAADDNSDDQQQQQLLLNQVFMLDAPGIDCLRQIFQWVSHGIVAMSRGFDAIDVHFEEQLLPRITARHALAELVLRCVHFRCFGTGRKFVIDAAHMLLRTAGHELADRLVRMVTCIQDVDAEWHTARKQAVASLVLLMASWQCIVTMTSASFGQGEAISSAFEKEILEETWSSSHRASAGLDDCGGGLCNVLACVKKYCRKAAAAAQQRTTVDDDDDDPIIEQEIPVSLQAEDDRTPNALPYMYLRSINIVPVEPQLLPGSLSSSSSAAAGGAETAAVQQDNREEQRMLLLQLRRNANAGNLFDVGIGDPTTARKLDQEAGSVWEFCWAQQQKLLQEEDEMRRKLHCILSMFRPILLYSAFVARNIVTVNAFYLHEHVASADAADCKRNSSMRGRRAAAAGAASLAFLP